MEGLRWPVGEKVGGGAGSPWSCHRIFEVSPEFLLRIYLYWVSLPGGVGGGRGGGACDKTPRTTSW